jgi:predicted nucleic acid-binding protein
MQPAAAEAPHIVLDTNAVLDCWLFEDPAAQALRRAVEAGRLRWLATAPMLAEFTHVLARPIGLRWEPQRERLLSANQLHSLPAIVAPAAARSPGGLRCSDPDDQKFLDTALHERVRWLVTRDRALLKLRRRAMALGLTIVEPAHCAVTIGELAEPRPAP